MLRRALLDGRYRWGTERTHARRYGGAIRRLVLYPPHTPQHLRRCARATRGWPIATPATAVPTGVLAAELTGAALSVAILAAMIPLLALFITLGRASATVRAGMLKVIVTTRDIKNAAEDERWVSAERLVWRLQDAEEDFDRELIDWDDYRQISVECFHDAAVLHTDRQ